jgi:hypothetical protein
LAIGQIGSYLEVFLSLTTFKLHVGPQSLNVVINLAFFPTSLVKKLKTFPQKPFERAATHFQILCIIKLCTKIRFSKIIKTH